MFIVKISRCIKQRSSICGLVFHCTPSRRETWLKVSGVGGFRTRRPAAVNIAASAGEESEGASWTRTLDVYADICLADFPGKVGFLSRQEAMRRLCQVTDTLFISDARSACSEELIRQAAVTLCINVSKKQPFPRGAVAQLRVPVYDDPGEDLYGHFHRCADAIHQEAAPGGRCLVYCKNGRSRSAAVCAAYLMKHGGKTLDEALRALKASRPVIQPNPGFLSQLRAFEEELRRRETLAEGSADL